jgi:hypothetical protein
MEAPRQGENRFSFIVQDVTLRQVLNNIAQNSGRRFWSFEALGPNRDSVTITNALGNELSADYTDYAEHLSSVRCFHFAYGNLCNLESVE